MYSAISRIVWSVIFLCMFRCVTYGYQLCYCFLLCPQYFQCKSKLPQTPKSTTSKDKQTSRKDSQTTSTDGGMEEREEEGMEEGREEVREEGREEKERKRKEEGREETKKGSLKRKRKRVGAMQTYDFTLSLQHESSLSYDYHMTVT